MPPISTLLNLQMPTRQEMAEIEESSRLYEDQGALVMPAVVIDGAGEGRPARAQVTFVLDLPRFSGERFG